MVVVLGVVVAVCWVGRQAFATFLSPLAETAGGTIGVVGKRLPRFGVVVSEEEAEEGSSSTSTTGPRSSFSISCSSSSASP